MSNHPQEPRTIARARGGWIALSPLGDDVQIGATGASEAEACDAFRVARAAWSAILASEGADAASSATESERALA